MFSFLKIMMGIFLRRTPTFCIVFWMILKECSGIAFENCNDGFTPHGGCQTVSRDGGIGSQSVNAVLLKDGYLDMGNLGGCPWQQNSCVNGFSYYGFVKLYSYPKTCQAYGVIASNGQFNIHILGNGRLAVYVWMEKDQEWYAETMQPVLLNVYYPLIFQFKYNQVDKSGQLTVIMQNQLSAQQNCSRPRTYTPPSPNVVWGGDGVTGNYAHVQLDRNLLDGSIQPIENIIGSLMDVNARRGNCLGKPYATLTRDFTCYWMEQGLSNWTDAYDKCNSSAYDAGYPYGRLARFPSDNATVWALVSANLRNAGVYQAWLGGGKGGFWLDRSQKSLGAISSPPNVSYTPSQSQDCLQVSTQSSTGTPSVSWTGQNCSLQQRFVCEMSWDCMLVNPCKNLGACQPINDGNNICHCFNGTSGKFCEIGGIKPHCVNNCPCRLPPIYHCENTTTSTSTTTTPTTKTTTTTTTRPTVVTIKSQSRLVVFKSVKVVSHQESHEEHFTKIVVVNVKQCTADQEKYEKMQRKCLNKMEKELISSTSDEKIRRERKKQEESFDSFSNSKRDELRAAFDQNQKEMPLVAWESWMKSKLYRFQIHQFTETYKREEVTMSNEVKKQKSNLGQMKRRLQQKCFVRQSHASKKIYGTYEKFFDRLENQCEESGEQEESSSTEHKKEKSLEKQEKSGSRHAGSFSSQETSFSSSSSGSSSVKSAKSSSSSSSSKSHSSSSSNLANSITNQVLSPIIAGDLVSGSVKSVSNQKSVVISDAILSG